MRERREKFRDNKIIFVHTIMLQYHHIFTMGTVALWQNVLQVYMFNIWAVELFRPTMLNFSYIWNLAVSLWIL